MRVVQGINAERRELEQLRVHCQTKARRCVQRVTHMQVVRPGFGPVFPRVGRRVAADVIEPPVFGWPSGVVVLQAGRVVLRLITKKLAKCIQPCRVFNQPIPKVVACFVTKVAQQGSVRLAHLAADRFANRVVSFLQVQGYQAAVMTRQNSIFANVTAHQVKRKSVGSVFHLRNDGQAQPEQTGQHTALGKFNPTPIHTVFRVRGIG